MLNQVVACHTFETVSSEHNQPPSTMDEIERRIEADPEPAIFRWYISFQFWKPGTFLIVGWWFLVILLGVFYGFKILGLTVFSFSAPSATDGFIADQKMQSEFSERADSRQLLLYFECASALLF